MNVTAHKSYDVLVVGAGMVGATLACALQQCNPDGKYRFLLLESAAIDVSKKPAQPAYDARSTALSAGSAGYLENLGLWTELQDYATAIRNIHVSDRGHFGAVRLHCDDYQLDALGFVIENIRLGQVLNRGVTAAPDIELRDATRVVDLMPIQDGMSVTVEKNGHKQRLEAQLVVLAEGGRSGLCERLGIHHKQTGYGQTAVIANVSFTDKHANVAFERFTDNGPLALLPLGSHEGDCRAAL
ncbi:MAG: FAD-dependent monooxygenase, partial [Pseudohongiellaceae bacterium]